MRCSNVATSVCGVQAAALQTASSGQAGQVYVRVGLEMKRALQVTLVVMWVWVVIIFGHKRRS